MAVSSTMVALGTQAPAFALPDVVSGRTVSLDDFRNQKALLVMFISRHCPYVRHVQEELARLGHEYGPRSVGIVGIGANDPVTHPTDAPEMLKDMAATNGFTFPVCFDETQETAKAYSAACTPDFFLFDGNRRLVYRGQLDDSRPNSGRPVTGRDLRAALDAVLNGEPVNPHQHPSAGCNIKWRVGNEPTYAR
jgi:peroxiredoxin